MRLVLPSRSEYRRVSFFLLGVSLYLLFVGSYFCISQNGRKISFDHLSAPQLADRLCISPE